jgi:RNA polymerase primary sigma factor
MTLEEVGQQFNLTRERVRQIKEKALRKMRHRHQDESV